MVWLSTVGSLWAFLWITIKKRKLCVNKTKKKKQFHLESLI